MTDHTIVLHDHDKSPADLVAEAIALCEGIISTARFALNHNLEPEYTEFHARMERLATIHLAEFREHKNHYIEVFPSDENYWLCNGCGESNAKDVDCEKKTTKAKRLLGVSE